MMPRRGSRLTLARPRPRAGPAVEIDVGFEKALGIEGELAVAGGAEVAQEDVGLAGAVAQEDSGSFPTRGMLIAPCSVRTMSEIATGVTSSLMTRAADVTLKERRLLVLMVRETPLHLGHLRTLVQLAEMGAVIAPPLPAFYAEPHGLADIVDQSVGRALDLFGLAWKPVRRWGRDVGPIAGEAGEA